MTTAELTTRVERDVARYTNRQVRRDERRRLNTTDRHVFTTRQHGCGLRIVGVLDLAVVVGDRVRVGNTLVVLDRHREALDDPAVQVTEVVDAGGLVVWITAQRIDVRVVQRDRESEVHAPVGRLKDRAVDLELLTPVRHLTDVLEL